LFRVKIFSQPPYPIPLSKTLGVVSRKSGSFSRDTGYGVQGMGKKTVSAVGVTKIHSNGYKII
jgi:hypothetical protein